MLTTLKISQLHTECTKVPGAASLLFTCYLEEAAAKAVEMAESSTQV
jgi:hypothetical protein